MPKPIILCVDDEQLVLDTLLVQLKKFFGEKFEYEIATEVDEAWELIHEFKADKANLKLVISDWLMPRAKGDEFLRELNALWPEVNMIMLSGHADPAQVSILKQMTRFRAFVRKPWDKEEFMLLIENILSE